MPDEEALAALRQRWHDLVRVWVKDDERHGAISEKWWQEMSREYGSPIRWQVPSMLTGNAADALRRLAGPAE